MDVKVSIELGVVSRLASLRARCAFSRHDHSMSCRSSTVKWHGTSLGFADEVGIYPVCQILASPTPRTEKKRPLEGSPPLHEQPSIPLGCAPSASAVSGTVIALMHV